MAATDNQSPKTPPINLLRGWPNPSLLPVELVKEATQAALSDPAVAHDGLLYGPDGGYEPAREATAAWLTDFYQPSSPTTAERICMSGGASQNLGCMLSVFTDPEYTRNVWIIAPAYFLAFRIFEDAGFAGKMRAVPEDDEGLDIEFFGRELEKSEAAAKAAGNDKPRHKPSRARAKVYKHVIYCVPTFANPSSQTMSLDRRERLVRLARKYDALVVADDVYDLLQWLADYKEALSRLAESGHNRRKAYLPRLVDIDRDLDGGAERINADGFGNACSNGSFSKIAGPGIRCGWVEGTKKFAYGVSQTGTTCSGGAPSQLTSTYMAHLLTTGKLQNHIFNTLQKAYAVRYGYLMQAIKTELLPLGFSLPQAGRDMVGGYFVWLGIPSGLTAAELADRCKDGGVIVAPGSMFEVPGDSEKVAFPKSVRLCFAWEEESNLSEGVKRMARAAQKLLHEEKSGVGEYVMVEKRDVAVDEYK